jgi:acetamidase/formamidase
MTTHTIKASADTVRWGMFDASIPPVLTVQSGDTVKMQCVSGSHDVLASLPPGLSIPPALEAIHAAKPPRLGPHIITGPVAVTGAQPGDMLEVKIDAIELGSDWGYCVFRPLNGTLPDEFPYLDISHIRADAAKGTCKLPWGPELKLAPFFGVMGVEAGQEFIFSQIAERS